MSVWPPAISPWLAWLALGVAAILVCLAIDVGPVQDLLYDGLGFVSAGLVVAGELKLDRSVIVGVGNERMVRAVAQLGQTLGLRLVAEGVEDEAELRLVQALGYDAVQGYLLGRPVEGAGQGLGSEPLAA